MRSNSPISMMMMITSAATSLTRSSPSSSSSSSSSSPPVHDLMSAAVITSHLIPSCSYSTWPIYYNIFQILSKVRQWIDKEKRFRSGEGFVFHSSRAVQCSAVQRWYRNKEKGFTRKSWSKADKPETGTRKFLCFRVVPRTYSGSYPTKRNQNQNQTPQQDIKETIARDREIKKDRQAKATAPYRPYHKFFLKKKKKNSKSQIF